MPKRRRLESGQSVLIIYDCAIGFVQQPATFLRYDRIILQGVPHEIPIFDRDGKELSGLECFWILPSDAKTPEKIERLQYELILLQVVAFQVGRRLGQKVPLKMQDKKLEELANEREDRLQSLIQKVGFDPRDESWVETELADTDRERKWFEFERKNPAILQEDWEYAVQQYNREYNDNLDEHQAKNLCKKRTRYLLGAFHTRLTGNKNRQDWKDAATKFEKFHRERETRMLNWSLSRKGKFPKVEVVKPVAFQPEPFRQQCLEKIPHLFVDLNCSKLKPGVVLRVVSYDPQERFIKLDFPAEVRKLLHGIDDEKPWISYDMDYGIYVAPDQIETHLKFVESLE